MATPRHTDLDHVAIAVEHHSDAWPRYVSELGATWRSGGLGIGFAPGQIAFANAMKLELLRPHRPEDNDFLRRFLDDLGPGAHHLTFKVPDLTEALDAVEEAGYNPVGVDRSDPEWQEAFLHPREVPGVVVQLAQPDGTEWISPAPKAFPPPPLRAPASLDSIGHAVADLDNALRLFAGPLHGAIVDEGTTADSRWVELAWPGPGRLRLLAPTAPSSPIARWLGERRGRVHHLAFSLDEPGTIASAKPSEDGTWEVAPADNLGVRLILRPRPPSPVV